MSKDPTDYLKHISDECSFILSVSQNLSFHDFSNDEILKKAIVRR